MLLSKYHFLEASFAILALKTIITQTSTLGESLVLVALVASFIFDKYVLKSKRDDKEDLLNQVNTNKEELIKMMNDMKQNHDLEMDQMRSQVQHIKIDKLGRTEKLHEEKAKINPIVPDPKKRFY